MNSILLVIGEQLVNGFPLYPTIQAQIGLWLITLHIVPAPHGLGQGSTHFWFSQAKLDGHSLLKIHSGLQFGGFPIWLGRQEHTACLFIWRHWLFGPQGDGEHTFSSAATSLMF